jgi:hypothetical protein
MMHQLHFPKSRFTSFFIHLLLSATILAILVSIVIFSWYPGALMFAGGAEQGLNIVIAVDMVLGPLLTLVVYNITKPRKELIRDLAIIAIFQISCLFVGMSLVYQQRPIAVVYSGNDFYILDQQGIEKHNIEMSILDSIEGPYPKIVFEKPPENEEERIGYDISKQPFFPLSFYSDLWIAFPNKKLDLTPYFKIEDESNCIAKKIFSYNQVGSICFDFNKQIFRDYK